MSGLADELSVGQQILIILGHFRDDMPPEAVREFQEIAALRQPAAPALLEALRGFTRNRSEITVKPESHPALAAALERLMDMADSAIAAATDAGS